MPPLYDIEIIVDQFVAAISSVIGDRLETGRVIRDVFGRLSFVPSGTLSEEERDQIVSRFSAELKPYLADQPLLGGRSTSPLLENLLEQRGLVRTNKESGRQFQLLDRRLAGEDWMQKPSDKEPSIPRFAFYGLKGGVGRSTALAVSAADLARHGLNILVVDLDLEAPGIGTILLNPNQQPEYGVLDWMAAGSAGADLTELIPDMLGGSSFTGNAGVIDVVPASGTATLREPTGFLSKLARAYTPGASAGRLSNLSFTEKIEMLLTDLVSLRRYDAVLLDVRAGLHETSAASLIGLGSKSFLFGTNSAQTLAGYNILLATIRQAMESWPDAPDLRNRFQMVHGRASSSLTDRSEFRAACWQLWLDNLYDVVGVEPDASAFSFDLDDADGPHFPWVILNSDTYAGFDPQKDAYSLHDVNYLPVFDGFVSNLRSLALNASLQ